MDLRQIKIEAEKELAKAIEAKERLRRQRDELSEKIKAAVVTENEAKRMVRAADPKPRVRRTKEELTAAKSGEAPPPAS